ncbi:hypothetical protein NCAS_0D01890 [Naumovozyma castellii]|uniref:Crh-like protein n=1 Tax=Naumovozyma castellii TaxID=27288 RepID=G0VDY0_NAUCA|nr:hypothetical protein NCAS_0D01890 [Naumovozyma castellii CBS 4309]CCC69770.1 hypothetical protein NCAS_0D01890 [Naumovozyma castellii CBS 4309]
MRNSDIFLRLVTGACLLSSTALAATTSCNPLSATGCEADTALATAISEDFHTNSSYFIDQKHAGTITYSDDGVALTLAKRFDNPALKSDFYIMYGKLEVILKAGSGTGIISSFYLQSDDLDEIDIEWVGGDTTQFQSNYFSKGNVTTYDRGEFHIVESPQTEYHNYTLDWAMDKTTWYLDGQAVRVLPNTTSEGYPQSPMYIMMGIWAGGDPDNAAGTIEWAGGLTDYSQAPFTMNMQKVVVTDYSTGKQYSYGDQSGSWESIDSDGGEIYGRYEQAQEDFATLVQNGTISTSESTSSSSTAPTSSSSTSLPKSSSTHISSTQSTLSSIMHAVSENSSNSTSASNTRTLAPQSSTMTVGSTSHSSIQSTLVTSTVASSSASRANSTSSRASSTSHSISTSSGAADIINTPNSLVAIILLPLFAFF